MVADNIETRFLALIYLEGAAVGARSYGLLSTEPGSLKFPKPSVKAPSEERTMAKSRWAWWVKTTKDRDLVE